MFDDIGQDVTDHLHEPGGPLHAPVGEECDECEQILEEGRYHVLRDLGRLEHLNILCDPCAAQIALKTIERFPARDAAEDMARDVLRRLTFEIAAGEWRRP